MKRGKQIDSWFPLWIDKWIFGSTRHELIIKNDDGTIDDFRGVFLDLMALSKKDGGYIRANEKTPYPHEQLAGMFCIPVTVLDKTISKCLESGKLSEPTPGIYYLNSDQVYSLTERHMRRVMSESSDTMSKNPDTRVKKNREEKSREKSIPFDEFWTLYPRKEAKKDALSAYKALIKTATPEEVLNAVHAYKAKIDQDGTPEKYIKLPATFLRADRWRDYLPKAKMTAEEAKAASDAELKRLQGER